MAETPKFDVEEFFYADDKTRKITFYIGVCCIEWSTLDEAIGSILGLYMKVKSGQFHIATGIIDLSRKCELVKALSFIQDLKAVHDRLVKILNFVDNTLRPIRNRYVHDCYDLLGGRATRTVYKAKIVNVQAFKKELVTSQDHKISVPELIEFNNAVVACSQTVMFHGLNMANTDIGDGSWPKQMSAAVDAAMKRYSKKSKD